MKIGNSLHSISRTIFIWCEFKLCQLFTFKETKNIYRKLCFDRGICSRHIGINVWNKRALKCKHLNWKLRKNTKIQCSDWTKNWIMNQCRQKLGIALNSNLNWYFPLKKDYFEGSDENLFCHFSIPKEKLKVEIFADSFLLNIRLKRLGIINLAVTCYSWTHTFENHLFKFNFQKNLDLTLPCQHKIDQKTRTKFILEILHVYASLTNPLERKNYLISFPRISSQQRRML